VEAHVSFKQMLNLRIRVVPPHGEVRVSAPMGTSMATVQRFIRTNLAWIESNQRAVRARAQAQSAVPRPLDASGGTTRLWGEEVAVRCVDGPRASARRDDEQILVTRPQGDVEAVHRAVEALVRRELNARIDERLPDLAARVERSPSMVKLRRMTSRWGTCNTGTKVITINTALAERPPHLLDYVLLHELVHLHERGHGERFQAWMNLVAPGWRECRKELRST